MRFRPPSWHDELASTNTYLLEALQANPRLPSGTVVAARRQSAGRGRHDRRWVTGGGANLAFSAIVRANVRPEWIPSLPMAASLGVARALTSFGVAPALKWPNDVLVSGRKICGILSECAQPPSREVSEACMVLGIGLNVNMTREEAEAIDRPATSLRVETGQKHDPQNVLSAVLDALPYFVNRWCEGGFPAIREAWILSSAGLGQLVVIRAQGAECGGELRGTLAGYGEFGELLLETPEGKRRPVLLGDMEVVAGEC